MLWEEAEACKQEVAAARDREAATERKHVRQQWCAQAEAELEARWSASLETSQSGAGVSSSRCIVMTTSDLNNMGVRILMCVFHSAPCDQCRQLGEHCVPCFGPKAPLACERCLQRKSHCSHVGPVVMSTPTTDIAAWTAVVRDGAERVTSTMDCQTDMFGLFTGEMCEMRAVVDHVSMSTVSSLWAAASTVADEEEDEEVREDMEEEQEGDVAVDVTMGEVGDESGGDEEENKGGEDDDNDDEDEEGGEEGRSGSGGAEWDVAPEASASVQVVGWPRVLQVAEWPCVPRPQWRMWKDKGKGKMQWEK
jgi:hypothetical protein